MLCEELSAEVSHWTHLIVAVLVPIIRPSSLAKNFCDWAVVTCYEILHHSGSGDLENALSMYIGNQVEIRLHI